MPNAEDARAAAMAQTSSLQPCVYATAPSTIHVACEVLRTLLGMHESRHDTTVMTRSRGRAATAPHLNGHRARIQAVFHQLLHCSAASRTVSILIS